MKKSKQSCLRQAVVAVMFAGVGLSAQAQDLVLVGNQVALGGVNVSVSADGLVDRRINVGIANYGIPSLAFNLKTNDIAAGTYSFRVGVTLDDDNSTRRIEMLIPKMDLVVDSLGDIISGSVDVSQKVTVQAHDGDATLIANITAPTGILTASGNSVSFDIGDLITSIAANNASIQTYLDTIQNNNSIARHYTYRIAIQGTGAAAAIKLAVEDGAESVPVPRIQSSCVLNPASQSSSVFVLNGSALAGNFSSAYALQGQYSVADIASSPAAAPAPFTENCSTTPETPEEADIEDDTTELDDRVTGIVIPATGAVPPAVVQAVNDALDTSSALAQNTVDAIAEDNVSLPVVVAAVQAINKALDTAAEATQKGADVSTSQAINTLESVAAILAAIGNSGDLNDVYEEILETETVKAVGSAAGLVTDQTTAEQAKEIVAVSAELIKGIVAASGNVSVELAEAVLAVIDATLVKVLGSSPFADDVDLTDPEALIGFLATSGAALQEAIDGGVMVDEGNNDNAGDLNDAVSDASFNPSMGFSWIPTVVSLGTLSPYFMGFDPGQVVSFTLTGEGLSGTLAATSPYAALAATEGPTIESDPLTRVTTIAVGSEAYTGVVLRTSIVSDQVPLGLRFLPDGRIAFVNSGYAVEMSSMTMNAVEFMAEIIDLGFEPHFRSNGSFEIRLGGSEHVSAAFAYDNLGAGADIAACGNITIGEPQGALNAPGYAFTAVCENGLTQRITPAVDSPLFYTTVAASGLEVTTDRNTGIVNVAGIGSFKPHFFVSTLTSSDQTYLNTNKNAEGVVFRTLDANGDGKLDYELLTATGKQVFFAL